MRIMINTQDAQNCPNKCASSKLSNVDTLQGKLHNFRKEIDACIQRAYYFKGENTQDEQDLYQFKMKKATREMSLVYTKLQEAKMWVGKCLEQLGSELPKEFQDKSE